MKRFITISLQYYRLLLIYNIGFSFFLAVIFYFYLGYLNAALFLFIKTFAFAMAVLIHCYSESACYFYFRNAGYRIAKVLAAAFALDYCFTVTLISLISIIQHAVNFNN